MEKRIGIIAILVESKKDVAQLNTLLGQYSSIVLSRQGLPIHDKGIQLISIMVLGSTDEISAVTGKIGRLQGIQVKSVLTKYSEDEDAKSTGNQGT